MIVPKTMSTCIQLHLGVAEQWFNHTILGQIPFIAHHQFLPTTSEFIVYIMYMQMTTDHFFVNRSGLCGLRRRMVHGQSDQMLTNFSVRLLNEAGVIQVVSIGLIVLVASSIVLLHSTSTVHVVIYN